MVAELMLLEVIALMAPAAPEPVSGIEVPAQERFEGVVPAQATTAPSGAEAPPELPLPILDLEEIITERDDSTTRPAEIADPPAAAEATPAQPADLEELEKILLELEASPTPATYGGEAARPVASTKVEGAPPPTVLLVRTHAKVASDYVRAMDIITCIDDPERIEPFLATIILCPSPPLDAHLTVSRDQLAERLKQYGVPLERVVMTGAREVLILRTKAAPGEPAQAAAAPAANGDGVKKGASVLIVRTGDLFRIEEYGTTAADGALGATIEIVDRKGRTFQAKVTGAGTVTPTEDPPSPAREKTLAPRQNRETKDHASSDADRRSLRVVRTRR